MSAATMKAQFAALTKSVKALSTPKAYASDLNKLIKLGKGHVVVVAHYEAGDNAAALQAAFSVGAEVSDYKGEGKDEHIDEAQRLITKIESLIAIAPKA